MEGVADVDWQRGIWQLMQVHNNIKRFRDLHCILPYQLHISVTVYMLIVIIREDT
jgi:hypothetical protein